LDQFGLPVKSQPVGASVTDRVGFGVGVGCTVGIVANVGTGVAVGLAVMLAIGLAVVDGAGVAEVGSEDPPATCCPVLAEDIGPGEPAPVVTRNKTPPIRHARLTASNGVQMLVRRKGGLAYPDEDSLGTALALTLTALRPFGRVTDPLILQLSAHTPD
jgi:hypothetical protein